MVAVATERAVRVGVQVRPQHATYAAMREAWRRVEDLGVDAIYTWDHFFPLFGEPDGLHYEGWTLLAAMAEVTQRAEIGLLVACNSYRNPNLLADMARTMDHISEGRFVLGIGSGYYKRDFEEYGYELGTVGSRLADLDRALETIKDRWTKLSPLPTRKIPILMAAAGEKVAMKIVAKHADEWQMFGDPETMRRRSEVLDDWCVKVGRDPTEIKRAAAVTAAFGGGAPADYAAAGFTHLIEMTYGPDWDLTAIKNLVAWRDAYNG